MRRGEDIDKIKQTISLLFWMALIVVLTVDIIQGEYVHLGPAQVYLDLSLVPEPYVEVGEPSLEFHGYGQGSLACTVYPGSIGHQKAVKFQLHQLEKKIQINKTVLEEFLYSSGLVPLGWTTESQDIKIDGHMGTMINGTSPYDRRIYLGCYSPDEVQGSGSSIFLVQAMMHYNCSRYLFESMRVSFE